MFEVTSRYAAIGRSVFIDRRGRETSYLRRRFLPQPTAFSVVAEVTLSQDDRLDNIAAKTLGAPELFWLLCDANTAMNPFDLVNDHTIGEKLKIPVPQPQDAIPQLNGVIL